MQRLSHIAKHNAGISLSNFFAIELFHYFETSSCHHMRLDNLKSSEQFIIRGTRKANRAVLNDGCFYCVKR